MFPLRDSQPSGTIPIVTYLIIAINVLLFLFEVSLGDQDLSTFLRNFGLVPEVFLQQFGPYEVFTLFSCMFLHGGWMHLISNMWALFIFGDNIEDKLGHFGYILFYLLCGVCAGLTQVFMSQGSAVPTIGASGAIAGVLGGYIISYPTARVLTAIPIFIVIRLVEIPASVYLGFWFISQFFTGFASIAREPGEEGGVAWWAHVGGFIAGLILVKIMSFRRQSEDSSFNYIER
ncbi:MAG: rhomboid family intramembrane serine protease [Candidatus Melainabacteria bacterium]|nr:MAG: rhomboid family intramembrane serine protease [Candidatus Melainabacteria bacterium]